MTTPKALLILKHAIGCSVALILLSVFSAAASAVTLPDNRAYEQVTPVSKGGANTVPMAISDDGNSALYASFNAFTGSSGGALAVEMRATRTPAGWQSSSVEPPASSYQGSGLTNEFFSSDLNNVIIALQPPSHLSGTGEGAAFDAVVGSDGSVANVTPPGGFNLLNHIKVLLGVSIDGESDDLSHLTIEGEPALVPGDKSDKSLVEDVGVGSSTPHYRLVGVTGPTSSDGDGELISTCATSLGGGDISYLYSAYEGSVFHAMSADGSTIFFTARRCRRISFGSGVLEVIEEPSVDELFARVGGTTTVPISEPSTGSCRTEDVINHPIAEECADAKFEGASADGSHVYFTTTQTDELPGNTDTTENLYLAKLSGGQLQEKVRVSAGDSSGEGARVQGVVRISDDGSHVYFVAQGVLSAGPNAQGQAAQSGADNLYGYDADTQQVEFIADLCSGEGSSAAVPDSHCVSGASDAALWGQDDGRPAQSTQDGRYLIFDSYGQLTPDDSDSAQDVYEYDGQTGTLVRVSAGHDGFDGNGNDSSFDATIPSPHFDVASIGDASQSYTAYVAGGNQGEARAVSDDGSFVFFTTSEPLQQDDVNHAPDVYEWHDGQVSLISDGKNLEPNPPQVFGQAGATQFLGASATGSDAFFVTTTVLDPRGGDGTYSIYDARIGGGFPLPVTPPPCSEDACQGAISPTPAFSTPGSASWTGGANLAEPASPKPATKPTTPKAKACKKGLVRQKNKCVRKAKKKAKKK